MGLLTSDNQIVKGISQYIEWQVCGVRGRRHEELLGKEHRIQLSKKKH